MREFNFVFREYSEEESAIYEKAMKEIIQNIKNGMSFQDAVDSVEVKDNELKSFIEDDALKILIAELCYVSKIPFEELANMLKIPLEKIRKANFEMLEDVALTLNNTLSRNRRKDA
ncbi:MAG: hypothetical protein NZ845_02050 [Thermodesulfovibrio sp.]|nr:hypothetical protein [Thermodesulfovibrio sp.]MCX7724614.1 hypothetical protein [Thermodesulfovibrio sp.]MDW7972925.1 hypothetical protein [Thermodesulfovibrio sp.]